MPVRQKYLFTHFNGTYFQYIIPVFSRYNSVQLARKLHTLLPPTSGCKRSSLSSNEGSRFLRNIIAYLKNYTASHKTYIRICNIRGNVKHYITCSIVPMCFILCYSQLKHEDQKGMLEEFPAISPRLWIITPCQLNYI